MRYLHLSALAAVMLMALAACAGPAPQPTMVPTVAPTVAPTIAPTVAVLPTIAPTVAVLPTVAPTVAPTMLPEPARRLGTFFFYWYNCPKEACDIAELSITPPGWLAPLPRDTDPRDGTAYSSINYDWFEGELRDIRATGIDTIFPVSWGDHPHPWFRQDRLKLLVQADQVLERPLAIGMFIDTTAQQAMYNDFTAEGYRFGTTIPKLPLADPRSGYFFYDRHIKGFFERIPRSLWATVAGRPIIITYTALCCSDLHLAGELWGAVKAAFARDFGVEPWLVLEDTWFTPEALAPGGELRPLEQVADGRYSWGTALNGPSTQTLRGYTVSSAGPGFDNSRIQGLTEPRTQSRSQQPGGGPASDGAFLQASLAAMPAEANLTLIETWNEWPESTGIARAAYRGVDGTLLPETFYMDIVRRWRESWR